MFEFDEAKSRSNLAKHGIDFVAAQELWDDPNALEIPAKTLDEPRSLVVGLIAGKHWSAVVTSRSGNIRIIWYVDREMKRLRSMKAKAFDRKFDRGEDITASLDLDKARRPQQDQRRVNVDFPKWMIERLDREARRLGVTRQSIIKIWLSERLEQVASNQSAQGRR